VGSAARLLTRKEAAKQRIGQADGLQVAAIGKLALRNKYEREPLKETASERNRATTTWNIWMMTVSTTIEIQTCSAERRGICSTLSVEAPITRGPTSSASGGVDPTHALRLLADVCNRKSFGMSSEADEASARTGDERSRDESWKEQNANRVRVGLGLGSDLGTGLGLGLGLMLGSKVTLAATVAATVAAPATVAATVAVTVLICIFWLDNDRLLV
jgi:hypothetical protein